MDTVFDLLHLKSSRGLVALPPEATVWEATALMNDQGIGSVLVVRGRRLVGIFTERDVLRRIVGERRSPTDTLVGDVMTADVICCGQEMPVDEIAELMRSHRVRHLPVLDAGGDVIGLVSIGDVNAHRFASCEIALHQVEDYMYRRA